MRTRRSWLKSPKIRQVAQNLRKQQTLGEILLWDFLKGRQIKGFKFTRQKPVTNYVLDFFCPELLLAIEIDGCSHDSKGDQNLERQAKLEQMGIRFLRYQEREIMRELDAVLEGIVIWIETNAPASGSLRVQKRKSLQAKY